MQRINWKYQKYLQELGLYHGVVDGIYGPKTKKAVKAFQRMYGLEADGIIGPKTEAEFQKHLRKEEKHYVTPPSLKRPVLSDVFKRWPRETPKELRKFYGAPGTNQIKVETPYPLRLAWKPSTKITKIWLNEKCAESAVRAMEEIKKAYGEAKIKELNIDMFGGSLNVRKIRGGRRYSTHAFGAAIDWFPQKNGLRTPWKKAAFSKPEYQDFVQAWLNEGWYSLGLYKNFDAMHFQACWRP